MLFREEKNERVTTDTSLPSTSTSDGFNKDHLNRNSLAGSSTSSTNPPKFDRRNLASLAASLSSQIEQKAAKEAAAAALPSYYNPGAINVAKYTDQIQKRKLIWGSKKPENVDQAAAKWQQTAKFSQDQDGKMASKFMRLMGIKKGQGSAGNDQSSSDSDQKNGENFAKKQQELFSNMEQQYEVARQATHTLRGMGLGFSSQSRGF